MVVGAVSHAVHHLRGWVSLTTPSMSGVGALAWPFFVKVITSVLGALAPSAMGVGGAQGLAHRTY